MIHSMTAFARESMATDQGVLTVELRSVNHRYLDCTFRRPGPATAGTSPAGARRGRHGQGKLDCLIRLQATPPTAANCG